MSYGLSRRTTASVGGNYRYTDFTHETAVQQDQTSQGLDGQFSYQRTRNLALRFSYHYLTGNLGIWRIGRHQREPARRGHLVFAPALGDASDELQLQLGFVGRQQQRRISGTSVARSSVPCVGGRVASTIRSRDPGRRSGAFRRGLEFVPGLAQPVYANGVTAGLDGLLNRRMEIGFAGGYSQGRSALTPAASQYDTYNGSVAIAVCLDQFHGNSR